MSDTRVVEYVKYALRSAFVSLFWGVISEKRRSGNFTLQSIADALDIDKSTVSRWFSADHPNWQTDTIAEIAHVLNLRVNINAEEVDTGKIFTPQGLIYSPPIIIHDSNVVDKVHSVNSEKPTTATISSPEARLTQIHSAAA